LTRVSRKLDEVVVQLAAVECDIAAMWVRLDNLDRRGGRIDLQRGIAWLAAVIEK
jgi:hypothetical protein